MKLGIETPDQVEIIDGATEGEKIILTGGYGLGDKAKISVQTAPPDSGAAKPDDKSAGKDDKNSDKKDPQ